MDAALGRGRTVLVHLGSGIGNIVLATPLLLVLDRNGFRVDLLIDGDYAQTADLFAGWSVVGTVYDGNAGQRPLGAYDLHVPAVPPFYWHLFAGRYRRIANQVRRPPDGRFYQDEQAYYLEFARRLGCDVAEPPAAFLPAVPDEAHGIGLETVVLAPGCKTGEMAAKRWPHFPALAETFEDVVVVGTADDLRLFDGRPMGFPSHVRSLVDRLSLAQTAGVLAAAGAVVANDSGLGHIAGAVGAPTLLLFGPTPDRTLGRLPPQVRVLRTGLACEPCWFGRRRLKACDGRVDCLQDLSVERVRQAALALLHDGA